MLQTDLVGVVRYFVLSYSYSVDLVYSDCVCSSYIKPQKYSCSLNYCWMQWNKALYWHYVVLWWKITGRMGIARRRRTTYKSVITGNGFKIKKGGF